MPALFTGSFNEDETKPEDLCGGQGEIQVVFFGQFTDDDAVAFHTGMHFLRETAGGCRVSTGLTDITGFRGECHTADPLGFDELFNGSRYVFMLLRVDSVSSKLIISDTSAMVENRKHSL